MNNLHDLVTAAWLTQVLREHGHIPSGEILTLRDVRFIEYSNNLYAHIHAAYVGELSALPKRLLCIPTSPIRCCDTTWTMLH